jgi:hypothetical protein
LNLEVVVDDRVIVGADAWEVHEHGHLEIYCTQDHKLRAAFARGMWTGVWFRPKAPDVIVTGKGAQEFVRALKTRRSADIQPEVATL